MSKLNLDAFKEQSNQTLELEKLTGGILDTCHSNDYKESTLYSREKYFTN